MYTIKELAEEQEDGKSLIRIILETKYGKFVSRKKFSENFFLVLASLEKAIIHCVIVGFYLSNSNPLKFEISFKMMTNFSNVNESFFTSIPYQFA